MRRAAKIDNNQREIVKSLREIPGVQVAVGHHDILVGRNGLTYWYEIKSATNRQGEIYRHSIRKSQKELLETWTGHYKIVASLEEILKDIGVMA